MLVMVRNQSITVPERLTAGKFLVDCHFHCDSTTREGECAKD